MRLTLLDAGCFWAPSRTATIAAYSREPIRISRRVEKRPLSDTQAELHLPIRFPGTGPLRSSDNERRSPSLATTKRFLTLVDMHRKGDCYGKGERQPVYRSAICPKTALAKAKPRLLNSTGGKEALPGQAVNSDQEHSRLGKDRHAARENQQRRPEAIGQHPRPPQIVGVRQPGNQQWSIAAGHR